MRNLTLLISFFTIFTIPWENLFTLPGVGTVSRLSGILLAGLWFLTVLTERKIRRIRTFHIAIILFVLWNVISFYWTIDYDLTLSGTITYIQNLFLIFILWDLYVAERSVLYALQAYVLGACVSVCGLIINYFSGVAANESGRYTLEGFNENSLSLIIVLGIPVAWYLIMTKHNGISSKWLNVINFLFIPGSVIAIILTATRGAVVAILPSLIFIFITFRQLKPIQSVFLLAILCGAAFLLFPLMPEYSIDRISNIGNDLVEGNLSRRDIIWGEGLALFAEHPITGIGGSAFRAAAESQIIAHNFVISILGEIGIIGFSLFAIILIIAFYMAFKQPALKAKFWITILTVWIIGASISNFEQRKQTWFFLGMVVISASAVSADYRQVNRQKSASLLPLSNT
mgnify:CR=1 FL=1